MTHDNQELTDAANIISVACVKVGVKRLILVAGIGIMQYDG